MNLGKITIIEGCTENGECLNDLYGLMRMLQSIVQACGLTVLNVSYHQFQPQGITILYLLSESHLSIHTWPEHQRFALDMYSCRDDYCVESVLTAIKEALPIRSLQHNVISRDV